MSDKIPAVRFDEVKQKVSEKYGHKMRNPFDLEPEEEQLIGQYAQGRVGKLILYLLPIILRKNVRFTQWMIRQIPDTH